MSAFPIQSRIDCSSRGWNGIGFTFPISPDCFRCRTSSPSPLYGIMHVTPREAIHQIQFNTSTQLIHNTATQTTCRSTENCHFQRILRHSTSKSHCSRHQVTTDCTLFIIPLYNSFTLNIWIVGLQITLFNILYSFSSDILFISSFIHILLSDPVQKRFWFVFSSIEIKTYPRHFFSSIRIT